MKGHCTRKDYALAVSIYNYLHFFSLSSHLTSLIFFINYITIYLLVQHIYTYIPVKHLDKYLHNKLM